MKNSEPKLAMSSSPHRTSVGAAIIGARMRRSAAPSASQVTILQDATALRAEGLFGDVHQGARFPGGIVDHHLDDWKFALELRAGGRGSLGGRVLRLDLAIHL